MFLIVSPNITWIIGNNLINELGLPIKSSIERHSRAGFINHELFANKTGKNTRDTNAYFLIMNK